MKRGNNMKKTIEKTIPSKKVKKDIYYCDLCGEEIDNPSSEFKEGKIYYQEEYANYGDCCDDISYYFDLCNKCVKDKVFPLIEKELKIKPRKDDESW